MNDVTGMEFDWLGVDREGFIALFSSAGFGPVPKAALDEEQFLTNITGRVSKLPFLGACRSIGSHGVCTDWVSAAQRGLFAYDWVQGSGTYYRLVAIPSVPIRSDAVADPEIARVAMQVVFDLDFREADSINVTI